MAMNPLDAASAYNAAARSSGARLLDQGVNDPTQLGGGANGQQAFGAVLDATMARQTNPTPGAQQSQNVAMPIPQGPAPTAFQANQQGPGTFGQLVANSVRQSVDSMRQGEHMSMQAIAGTADLRDVVMAVANAEITLDTVITVRDKVIGAYNEIIKMPI